jgi:2,3-bisphosphoglycerate-independent phosphoglycerate mutase
MGDLPIQELENKTPLEAADTPNMDFLAKTGKTGLMYTVGKGIAPESDVAVLSILGYNPFRHAVSRGVIEVLGVGLKMKDGDLALRCNFATLGQGNRILDRRVGRSLTTEEASELSKAINEKIRLESHQASFEFRNTIGHRGALLIRSRVKKLTGSITNTDPAYTKIDGISVAMPNVEMLLKKCEALEQTEEAAISANLVNEFTKKSTLILDEHLVNKKRAKEGKLKANAILIRDAGNRLPRIPYLSERFGLRFACLIDMPVERGISKLAGMHTVDLPPRSKNIEKDCEQRAQKLLEILPDFDCFYIHIKGPDEAGHDGDFELKTQLISIVDKHFFGRLLRKVDQDHIFCVTADHSTPCKLKGHSDDPVPLLISGFKIDGDGVQRFSEAGCRNGELGILEHGFELMPKLTSYLKEQRSVAT